MKKVLLLILILSNSANHLAQIVGWDVYGVTDYGVSPFAAKIVASNITVDGLTRGAGVTTSSNAANNAWGGTGWATDIETGISGNKFISFSITPNTGYVVCISSMSLYYRRSSSGATKALLQYKISSGSFINITTLNFSSNLSSGALHPTIDLSSFPDLQDISDTSTVTIRLVPYGASSSSGTFYIYNTVGNDLSIEGIVKSNSVLPDAPVASQASDIGQTFFTANWNPVIGASTYSIDVSTDSNFTSLISGFPVDIGNVSSKIITGLTASSEYYYRIRALNSDGESENSNSIKVVTLPDIPDAPVAIEATFILSSGFTANWNPSIGASKYYIDVSTSSDFSTFIPDYNNADVGNVISFEITSLSSGVKYYYRIRANNACGTSVNSNVIELTTKAAPKAGIIINEWSQGASGAKEWVEILVVSDHANLQDYKLVDGNNSLSISLTGIGFQDIRKGSLIVIYNGGDVDATITPDLIYDGITDKNLSISSLNNSGQWTVIRNTGWNGTVGAFSNDSAVDLPKLQNNSSEQICSSPQKLAGNKSGYYLSDTEAGAELLSNWNVVSSSSGTPGLPNGGVNTDWINNILATGEKKNPSAPVAASATSINANGFTANWSTVPTAEKYFLDVATTGTFEPDSFIGTFNNKDIGIATSENITGLNSSTTFYYRVRSSNVYGTSAYSNAIQVTTNRALPGVPYALHATNITNKEFAANWISQTNSESYFVEVSTDSNFISIVGNFGSAEGGNENNLIVSYLNAGTQYYYRVRASNTAGVSECSNIIKVITTPAAPSIMPAINIQCNGFTANWNSSRGAITYQLDLSTSPVFSSHVENFRNKDVGDINSYTVTNLETDTKYYVRIRASNVSGVSPSSDSICVTTSKQILNAGDIAIIGINTDSPDSFSFIPLVDLIAGTVIKFSDSGVKADGSFRGGEGAVKYKTPPGGIVAGTIITFEKVGGVFTFCNDAIVGNTGFSLSTSGDQVIAFQDSSATPKFLYAVSTYRDEWQAEVTNTNNSSLPLGLVDGISALALGSKSSDTDNAVYNMIQTQGTKDELLSAVGDLINWIKSQTVMPVPTGMLEIGKSIIPMAPVLAEASKITTTGFSVSWNAIAGATKYFLDLSSKEDFTIILPNYYNRNIGGLTSLDIIGLRPGKKYFVRVRSSNTCGISNNSNTLEVTTNFVIPATPVAKEATNVGITNFTAAWNYIENAAKYSIEVSSDPNFKSHVINFTKDIATDTTCIVRGLEEFAKYYCRLRASNQAGQSQYSNVISVTTYPIVPAVPVALSATKISSSGFNVNWKKAAGANFYLLYVSTSPEFSSFLPEYVGKNVGADTTIVLNSLMENTDYYYRVRSANSTGTSNNSNTIKCSTSGLGLPIPNPVYPANEQIDVDTCLTFIWKPEINIDGYELQITKDKTFSSIDLSFSNLLSSQIVVNQLLGSSTYYWRIRTISCDLKSNWSSDRSFTTKLYKPVGPLLITPSDSARKQPLKLLFSWQKTKNCNTYTLEVSDKKDLSSPIFTKDKIKELSYWVSGLKHNTNYWWRVCGTNSFETGSFSKVRSFTTVDTINAPGNLLVTLDIKYKANLTWKDNSANETGFVIERSSSASDTFIKTAVIPANFTSYKDTTVLNGKSYSYRIMAVNNDGSSDYSNVALIRMPTFAIKSPTNLVTRLNKNGHVEINWSDNSNNEKGFRIFRKPAPVSQRVEEETLDEDYEIIGTVSTNVNCFIDSLTKEGNLFNYAVVAFNEEDYSLPVLTRKYVLVINAPQKLSVVNSNMKAALTWQNQSTLNEGTEILRATKTNSSFLRLFKGKLATPEFIDTTVIDGYKYYYQVAVYSDSSFSAGSNIDSVFFAIIAPTNIKGEQLMNENKIKISWKDNSRGEDGYIIERKSMRDNQYVELAKTDADAESYLDEKVINKSNYTYRIKCFNEITFSDYTTESGVIVGIEKLDQIPSEFKLLQNYPNPFNSVTKIRFTIPVFIPVKLILFDALGRFISELINRELLPGDYNYSFTEQNLSSGIYFYILEAGSFRDAKKLILLK